MEKHFSRFHTVKINNIFSFNESDTGESFLFRSICSETNEKAVVELQQQLHEKDMKLTDIRFDVVVVF